MADNKVNFLRGTSAEYETKTKDNDTFYYTTDTKKLYLGENEITGIEIDDTSTTATDKTWSAKKISDNIPTTLPANGGNADTVDGLHADDFVKTSHESYQIPIPNDVDVPIWIANNAKLYTRYYTCYENTGLTNVAGGDPTDFVWYYFDGINIIATCNMTKKVWIACVAGGVFIGWVQINTTSLPANGGNADTLGGYYPKDIFKFIGNKNTENDCNDCSETGFYFFNGCGANAPTTGGTVSSGTYFVLENLSYNDSYFKQTAMFVHGASNLLGRIFNRYCNNGEWSEWVEINGNADTLDGLHESSFLQNLGSWSSGNIKDLMLAATKSGMVWITNTVTGMPIDGTWWFGILDCSNTAHRCLRVNNVGNGYRYAIVYNASTGWVNWISEADGGNAATVNGFTITSGTEDLNPGVSELPTNTIYLVYE